MKLNKKNSYEAVYTHEGAPASSHLNEVQKLRRSIMSCMLWEDEFYEDGQSIATRISQHADNVDAATLAEIAKEARLTYKLRHVPLLLVAGLLKKGGPIAGQAVYDVVNRPDELMELLAIYWKDGKKPLSKQLKKGLAAAFSKFDEYQFAKYDRDTEIKLRDVLFLTHPKPKDHTQEVLFKKIAERTLSTPDTWETNLSAGKDKKETWERLLREGKLGYMALLRNLRNMDEVGVNEELIREGLSNPSKLVLPFRFITAARAAPRFERDLDAALEKLLASVNPFSGKTVVLVDVSGSMYWGNVSAKSTVNRMDAAAGLASIIPSNNLRTFAFSNTVEELPSRKGMAGVDTISHCSVAHGGTNLGAAISHINQKVTYDRLIVITDEQSHDYVPAPTGRGYIINVGSYQNGVGYDSWVHVNGFSEATLKFIQNYEEEFSPKPTK